MKRSILIGSILLIAVVLQSVSTYAGVDESFPSMDVPAGKSVTEMFNATEHRFLSNNSKTQLLGIETLVKLWHDTNNSSYLEQAEDLWDYCKANFSDPISNCYEHNLTNTTIYTEDNCYGITANLALYNATNTSKYLERANSLAQQILGMRSETFFNLSTTNPTVDLNVQALAVIALFDIYEITKNQTLLDESLRTINSTNLNYLDKNFTRGYKIDNMYYGAQNVKLAVAAARAYKLTNISDYRNITERIVNFIMDNLTTLDFGYGPAVVYCGIENGTYYNITQYMELPDVQLWMCIALSETYEITGNVSYLELGRYYCASTIWYFWNFLYGGFGYLEADMLAVIGFEKNYELKPTNAITEINLTVPKSKKTSIQDYCSAYGIFNFTAISDTNITDKIIFDLVKKLGAYPIPEYYQRFEPAVISEQGNDESMTCYINGEYFIIYGNLSSGYNNLTLLAPIPIIFVNTSINATHITMRFANLYSEPVIVNRTEFLLTSTNISLKKCYCNGSEILYDNTNYSSIVISNLSYTGNMTFTLEYEDKEPPNITSISFKSHGETVSQVEKGAGGYAICSVEDNNVLDNVKIFYNNGSGWKNTTMTPIGNNIYQAYMGIFEKDLEIHVEAKDVSGNLANKSTTLKMIATKEDNALRQNVLILIAIIIVAVVIAWVWRKWQK